MKRMLLLMFCAFVITAIAAETALRFCLSRHRHVFFNKLKAPGLYGMDRGEDDFWYYIYLWGDKSFVNKETATAGAGKSFYSHWAVGLEFDSALGYRRKPRVTFPGHETSNLATRSVRHYGTKGPKIVFYGDSFVESNAFSDDTLSAKIEKKTGMDCLNYGVGGYGLDQVYLLFEQTYQQFDPAEARFLIGVTDDELLRLLLKVRQAPKPYFTARNSQLELHTRHIDAADPRRYFEQYRPRFRIFLLELLLHEIKPLNRLLAAVRRKTQTEKIKELSSLLVERFQKTGAHIAFVVFSDWQDNVLKKELLRRHIPFLPVDEYLRERMGQGKAPALLLYPEGHPTPQLNEVIADYIVEKLGMPKRQEEK